MGSVRAEIDNFIKPDSFTPETQAIRHLASTVDGMAEELAKVRGLLTTIGLLLFGFLLTTIGTLVVVVVK